MKMKIETSFHLFGSIKTTKINAPKLLVDR